MRITLTAKDDSETSIINIFPETDFEKILLRKLDCATPTFHYHSGILVAELQEAPQ